MWEARKNRVRACPDLKTTHRSHLCFSIPNRDRVPWFST